jgi:hypothetical protein
MVADHSLDLKFFTLLSTSSVSNFAFDKTDKVRSILIRSSLKNGFRTTIEFSELLKIASERFLN